MTTEANAMASRIYFGPFFRRLGLVANNTFLVFVFVMRELDFELCDVVLFALAAIRNVAKTRKQEARRISRRDVHMTVRADGGRGSLPRKELLAMTVETGSVCG